MKEQIIINKIKDYLRDEDEAYEIIDPIDNEELRSENIVSVCLDNIQHLNQGLWKSGANTIGLPDYRYDISIYVSTHISEDPDGSLFTETCEKVEDKMEKLFLNDVSLSEVFGEIPVVAVFFDSSARSVVDDSSGKCLLNHLKYYLIASFN